MTELELQKKLEEIIINGQLYNSINNADEKKKAYDTLNVDTITHYFSIDYFMRSSCLTSSHIVLEHLKYDPIIVSSNTSISKKSGEVLRPDIVLRDLESNAIVIIEIKKDKQTAREAMTELLAYEHEIQNILPASTTLDICYVIISEEWSPLLDHSIANLNTWTSKHVLGLQLTMNNSDISLSIRIPDAWSFIRGDLNLNSMLTSFTICLYPQSNCNSHNDDNDGDFPIQLKTALNMIVNNGNIVNSNGFVIIGEHHGSVCRWSLTVAALNPFAFFLQALDKGDDIRRSDLFDNILEIADEYSTDAPSSLIEICKQAIDYLGNWWIVDCEGFTPWNNKREELENLFLDPVELDFWGKLGEHVRNVFASNTRAKSQENMLSEPWQDWTFPDVGIRMIDILTRNNPLISGTMDLNSCYRSGVVIGQKYNCMKNMLTLKQTEREDESVLNTLELLSTVVFWNNCQFKILLDEIKYFLSSRSEQRESKLSKIEIKMSHGICPPEQIEELIHWMKDEVIPNDHDLHVIIFQLGMNLSFMYSKLFSMTLDIESQKRCWDDNFDKIQMIFNILYEEWNNDDPELCIKKTEGMSLMYQEISSLINDDFKLSDEFWKSDEGRDEILLLLRDVVFDLMDYLVPTFQFINNSNIIIDVDWDYLKQGIKGLLGRGSKYPALILAMNGEIGIGDATNEPGINCFPEIEDHDAEVLVVTHLGFTSIQKMSWDDIMSNGIT